VFRGLYFMDAGAGLVRGDTNRAIDFLDGNSLAIPKPRVFVRVDVAEITRLGRENRSFRYTLDQEGVVVFQQEPLQIRRHFEGLGKWAEEIIRRF